MSVVSAVSDIEYPESDGMPMGETDLHIEWMIRLRALMLERYRGKHAYVASNLLLYFEEGSPYRYVVPDVFVVLDHPPGKRRTYKTWEEKKSPDVVFEVTSKSTRREDQSQKPNIYAALGIGEYFLYGPTAEYLRPALAGYRLAGGSYHVIEPNRHAQLESERLGITLELRDGELVLRDTVTGEELLTPEEAADRRAAEAEQRSAQAEQRSAQAEQRSAQAEQRSARVKQERDALRIELERLRRQLKERSDNV